MSDQITKFWMPLLKHKGVIKDNKINTSSPYVSNIKTSNATTVDVIAPKKKYASIGTSQMRSGRSSTIQTSSVGLLSQASIKKKTLLGG